MAPILLRVGLNMKVPARQVRLAATSASALIALILCLVGVSPMSAKEKPQSGMAEVNGTKLYYETAGKGPAGALVPRRMGGRPPGGDPLEKFAKNHPRWPFRPGRVWRARAAPRARLPPGSQR